MHSNPPRGLAALLLLHILAFGGLGVFGVLNFLADAGLRNNVNRASFVMLGFGAFASLSAWVLLLLGSHNPLRNRRSSIAVASIAWLDLGALALAIPSLFYRLRVVPLDAWIYLVPTAIFAVVASWHVYQLSAAHGRAVPGHDHQDSTAHSERPA